VVDLDVANGDVGSNTQRYARDQLLVAEGEQEPPHHFSYMLASSEWIVGVDEVSKKYFEGVASPLQVIKCQNGDTVKYNETERKEEGYQYLIGAINKWH